MRKLIAFEWITIDGVFDADPEYFEKWFHPYHSDERAEFISKTIEDSGALLLGGNTYRMLAPYWSGQETDEMGPASKLNSMPKYVVSSTLEAAQWNNTRKIIRENVAEEIAGLKQQSGGDILITGSGTLVRSVMETGLVDEFRLLVHPVVMGKGQQFFQNGLPFTKLNLMKSQPLPLGVIALFYKTNNN